MEAGDNGSRGRDVEGSRQAATGGRRTSLIDARRKNRDFRAATVRQGRTRTLSPLELHDRLKRRIADLYLNGSIKLVPTSVDPIFGIAGTRQVMSDEVAATLRRLEDERALLERQLGDHQVLAGVVYSYRRNGVEYMFAPYRAGWSTFVRAIAVQTRSETDRIVWLLWTLRNTQISVAKTEHKVRSGLVECPGCGYRHSMRSRPRDEHGFSSCRKCGDPRHTDVREKLKYKPLPRITKAYLRRRFHLSERELDRILAIPLPETPDRFLP